MRYGLLSLSPNPSGGGWCLSEMVTASPSLTSQIPVLFLLLSPRCMLSWLPLLRGKHLCHLPKHLWAYFMQIWGLQGQEGDEEEDLQKDPNFLLHTQNPGSLQTWAMFQRVGILDVRDPRGQGHVCFPFCNQKHEASIFTVCGKLLFKQGQRGGRGGGGRGRKRHQLTIGSAIRHAANAQAAALCSAPLTAPSPAPLALKLVPGSQEQTTKGSRASQWIFIRLIWASLPPSLLPSKRPRFQPLGNNHIPGCMMLLLWCAAPIQAVFSVIAWICLGRFGTGEPAAPCTFREGDGAGSDSGVHGAVGWGWRWIAAQCARLLSCSSPGAWTASHGGHTASDEPCTHTWKPHSLFSSPSSLKQ